MEGSHAEEVVKGTLQWCNEIRKKKGLPPADDLPKGKKSDGRSCPCGKLTGLSVGCVTYYELNDDGKKKYSPGIQLPAVVTDFVLAFDSGKYPQYEEEER